MGSRAQAEHASAIAANLIAARRDVAKLRFLICAESTLSCTPRPMQFKKGMDGMLVDFRSHIRKRCCQQSRLTRLYNTEKAANLKSTSSTVSLWKWPASMHCQCAASPGRAAELPTMAPGRMDALPELDAPRGWSRS
eukprot:4811587-Pleurochrysis_carterae.AAC.5